MTAVEPGGPPPASSALPGQFSCRNCGAQLHYEPGVRSMRCPYCATEQDVPAIDRTVDEHSFDDWVTSHRVAPQAGVRVLECGNCRARTESDHLSTRCPFCGSPLVSDVEADSSIAPEGIVPFIVDRRRANDALRTWIRSRRFAPGQLRKVSTSETIESTYLPFWTFDAHTATDYRGQRGEHYWATETYTTTVDGRRQTKTRQVRKTRWYPASGHVTRHFDDVAVPATIRVEPRRLSRLEPFHVDTAVAYQPEYLAGHQTLRYEIGPEQGLAQAKQTMAEVIEGDCREDIGGDTQRVSSMDTRYANVMFKLLLVPLWLVAYVYHGKTYQVMVNAHSGMVVGERPWSVWKIVLAVVVGVLALAAALALIALASGDAGAVTGLASRAGPW